MESSQNTPRAKAREWRQGNAGSTTVTLNGVLTNLGVLRWISANQVFDLRGSGRVENVGLWEIYQDPAFAGGSDSVVRVPVNVPVGGRLLLSTNGRVNFTQPSSLTVAGTLELQTGTRLLLDGSVPARDLTLLPGSTLSGVGVLRLEGSNRLVLGANTTVAAVAIQLSGNSLIAGSFTLVIGANASLTVDHSTTIPGSVTVLGTLTTTAAGVTLTINGALVLEAGSTVNNPGTIRAGSLANNGATIVGNAPTPIGAGASFTIQSLEMGDNQRFARQAQVGSRDFRPDELRLSWTGLPNAEYAIETSLDLRNWVRIDAEITSPSDGWFEAIAAVPQLRLGFFRIVEASARPAPPRATKPSEEKRPSLPPTRPIHRP